MMSRKFTTREKVLLLVCAVLLLGILYYRVVWVETANIIAANDVTLLEDEMLLEQMRATSKKQMVDEMAGGTMEPTGEVAVYNNLQNEINELNSILASADTYNIGFFDATLDGTTVRRDVNITFHTGDYGSMKSTLQKLHDCQYRCLIQDMTVSTTARAEGGIQRNGDINVSLKVTFYETTNNAETTIGLPEPETEAAAESEQE